MVVDADDVGITAGDGDVDGDVADKVDVVGDGEIEVAVSTTAGAVTNA